MADVSDLNLPRLVQALDEVAHWREDQESAARGRLDEIAEERQRLQADIDALQRQIETLGDLSTEVEGELSGLAELETRRTRAAVDKGIADEAAVLAKRNQVYVDVVKAREDNIADLLGQPDVSRLVEEYEQFQEAEPTLGMLPEGYRNAILAHHETVKVQLEPVMAAARAPLAQADVEPDAVTVVASLNPESGPPEALAVLLPVPFDVYEDWSDRGEDLASLLAYRVVAALGATLTALGVPDAPMQFADYRGKLAIQVWLGDSEVEGDLKEALVTQVDRMREDSLELAAVRLELYTAWLDPEVVATAEDDDDDGDDLAPHSSEGAEDDPTIASDVASSESPPFVPSGPVADDADDDDDIVGSDDDDDEFVGGGDDGDYVSGSDDEDDDDDLVEDTDTQVGRVEEPNTASPATDPCDSEAHDADRWEG